MKKRLKAFVSTVCLAVVLAAFFSSNVTAYANMAAPLEDRGSGVLFDRHESISVDSEVLNIQFHKSDAPKNSGYKRAFADITAIYTMTNSADQAVSVQAMFLSPVYNPELKADANETDYTITVDGMELAYSTEYFSSGYESLNAGDLLDWEKLLAASGGVESGEGKGYAYVSAVNYAFSFEPHQTLELQIRYRYIINMNTYRKPDETKMRYFLTPAKYWKDFGKLTINLTLDDEQPFLKSSSLDFKQVKKGVYVHESYGLPDHELEIVAGKPPIVAWFFGGIVIALILIAIFLFVYLSKRKKARSI